MTKTKFSTKKFLLALISILILVIAQTVAIVVTDALYITAIPEWVVNITFGIVYVFLAYFLIKLLCVKILKVTLDECYITKIHIKPIWILSALLLPILVSGVLLLMPGELVKNRMETNEMLSIVTNAVFNIALGAGVVEELVFRGVIMSAIESRWNKTAAIIIPSMAFGLLHIIGADLDFISIILLFIAGTGVGILFSLVTYESGSIWNSAIIHGVWNLIMGSGILNIGAVHNQFAIFSYTLDSKSFIITGGDFGIEASIISVCGYAIFSVLAFYLWKRNIKK